VTNAGVRPVVVDSSLALKWVIAEPDTLAALALLTRWSNDDTQPVVPSWFAGEAGNVLFQRVRRNELLVEEAKASLQSLLAVVVALADEPGDAVRALDIAYQFRQNASYDAQYLALAERLDCELWTADSRFWNAVHEEMPRVRLLTAS
jgi:predicted nucleic acid-binding protein